MAKKPPSHATVFAMQRFSFAFLALLPQRASGKISDEH
jgi:hypothetical protein